MLSLIPEPVQLLQGGAVGGVEIADPRERATTASIFSPSDSLDLGFRRRYKYGRDSLPSPARALISCDGKGCCPESEKEHDADQRELYRAPDT